MINQEEVSAMLDKLVRALHESEDAVVIKWNATTAVKKRMIVLGIRWFHFYGHFDAAPHCYGEPRVGEGWGES